jgi:hypothetical protein
VSAAQSVSHAAGTAATSYSADSGNQSVPGRRTELCALLIADQSGEAAQRGEV